MTRSVLRNIHRPSCCLLNYFNLQCSTKKSKYLIRRTRMENFFQYSNLSFSNIWHGNSIKFNKTRLLCGRLLLNLSQLCCSQKIHPFSAINDTVLKVFYSLFVFITRRNHSIKFHWLSLSRGKLNHETAFVYFSQFPCYTG